MSRYPILLLDADNTLFDFNAGNRRAFAEVCRVCKLPDSDQLFHAYEKINDELWGAFDRREVSKDFVTLERYVRFFRSLGLDRDPAQANRDYLDALGSKVFPLPHAEEVCRTLFERGHQLYIVTNAVASVQRRRLQSSIFAEWFTDAFISEEAGASKPDAAYYDYVRRQVPGITEVNTLVIGDSLVTDILGANNAGLPCCWFNPNGKPRREGLRIDYEITDLRELLSIV